ncbi:MAG: hypothetical protein CL609_07125 [Anaerolineaceae bacterium]|nr:hypothetical protein [Anaerolineaceae bacterium]
MFANKKHILALTKIKRTRTFPSKGQVNVRVGQKVSANEAIGEYIQEKEYSLINVRKLLNLNNNKDARQLIKCKVADTLQQDDLIAESGGLFSKTIRAPYMSEVLLINSSQILLQNVSNPVPLLAGMDSIVVEILPDRGAILEANGVLIQGIWGNQRIQSGMLIPILENPSHKLQISDIDVTYRGSILVGGYCDDINIIKYASELPLKGLVLSSIHPDLLSVAENSEVAIIVTDGFGDTPMNVRTFELLTTNSKRDTSVNAEYNLQLGKIPEIIIPLPAEGYLPNDITEFKPGLIVRINHGPQIGLMGEITKIMDKPSVLPHGIKTMCALVKIFKTGDDSEQKEQLFPLANIDVVE